MYCRQHTLVSTSRGISFRGASHSKRRIVMVDKFSMQWHITDRCDQRCKHCYIYEGKDKKCSLELDLNTLNLILEDFISSCKQLGKNRSLLSRVEIRYSMKEFGIFLKFSKRTKSILVFWEIHFI